MNSRMARSITCQSLILLIYFILFQSSFAFVDRHQVSLSGTYPQHQGRDRFVVPRTSVLKLIPLSKFQDSLTFFKEPDEYRCIIDSRGNFFDGDMVYELGLVEEEDLPDLCRFVVATFGADAIRISQDLNAFERMLMSPAAEFLNGYSGLVAFAEVYSGTKQRLADRFHGPDGGEGISAPSLAGLSQKEKIRKAERDSLVLVLARQVHEGTAAVTQNIDSGRRILDVVASIELRLQPCDAKIPFSIPWLDRVERRLGALIGLGDGIGRDLQPYLSNLCVDERYRGRQIGRSLVRCVENIARTNWGYSRIYLHVDEDNQAALKLYQSEGYRDVGHRWNPFWSGNAARIGYYVKRLSKPTS